MNKSNDKVIIEIYDDLKRIHRYELLDIVYYSGKEYVVMMEENSFDREVTIFHVIHSQDKSATFYKPEEDNYIASQVYLMFKEKFEKYYDNRICFEDNN